MIGPHFVASAVRCLPSPLRDRCIQESWLKFFSVITELMMSSASGYQTELSITLSSQEKEFLCSSIRKLLQEKNKFDDSEQGKEKLSFMI